MFEFIEKAKLEIRQRMELRKLHKQRDSEMRELHQEKQFEIGKTELERQVELEGLKAKVRNEQQKSQPKGGEQQKPKTLFGQLQNFADNFVQNQQKQQRTSAVGNLGMGLPPPSDKPEQRKKRKQKKKKTQRKEVKMVYVPMNQFGNKTVWRQQ